MGTNKQPAGRPRQPRFHTPPDGTVFEVVAVKEDPDDPGKQLVTVEWDEVNPETGLLQKYHCADIPGDEFEHALLQ